MSHGNDALAVAHVPVDLDDFKRQIVSGGLVFLGRTERVARFALESPEAIAFGTIQSVASECSVAPSTVARMVQCAGFKHFRDFKYLFERHLRARNAKA